MDYKVIIILLALLFLIILVYREVSNLKDQFNKNTGHMSLQFRQNTDKMLLKFQNNMNKYVSQIKTISSDNLQQLRKITILNHQPVTRLSNHFTETDGSEIKTDIQYLSDMKGTDKHKKLEEKNNSIFEKKEEHQQFYMSSKETNENSDDENSEEHAKSINIAQMNINKNSGSITNNDNNIVCDGDKCYISKSNIEENKDTEQIPIYQVEKEDELPIYKKKTNENSSTKSLTNDQLNKIVEDDEDDNYEDYESDDNENNDGQNDVSELVKVDIAKYNILTHKTPEKPQKTIATSNPTDLENSIIDDDDENYTSEENISVPMSTLNYKNQLENNKLFDILSIVQTTNSADITNIINDVSNNRFDRIYINDDDDTLNKKNLHDKTSEICSDDTFNVENNIQTIDLSASVNNLIHDSKNSKIDNTHNENKNAQDIQQNNITETTNVSHNINNNESLNTHTHNDEENNRDNDNQINDNQINDNQINDNQINDNQINETIDDQIIKARNKKMVEEINEHEIKSKASLTSKKSLASYLTVGGTRRKKPTLSINTKIDDEFENELNLNIKQNNIENNTNKELVLKNYEDYTYNDLRNLARKLSIPTTYKEKNKTKQYKKEELYDNIEKSLNSNKK
ncbi:hypothetical protein QKU48_gp0550 [Fadolivirus algeromassiliense]|jgi:hypothetical protein|uniref:Uncharacterized protein n=1 Tax=Fadolivirus FV1/VV64 TaxID=3070911 RepID=A0A7D3UPK6_9VIRU|nr:hypothetical protein QKU48_gp0550 [Fadolivirus algeromassiliense]QKF94008.1 hypothetical protein Fadolivirus_1_550 [Fadolivirus FV1/VV64]